VTSQPQASRENILHRVRTALGRSAAQPPADPPPVRLRIPEVDMETRIATMMMRIEALAGKTYRVATQQEACALVSQIVEGKTAGRVKFAVFGRVRSHVAARGAKRDFTRGGVAHGLRGGRNRGSPARITRSAIREPW